MSGDTEIKNGLEISPSEALAALAAKKSSQVKKKAEALKTTTPGAKKAGTVKKVIAKKEPAVDQDLIAVTVTKLENLTMVKATKLLQELREESSFNLFQIGGIFSVVHSNGWYTDAGYDKIDDYAREWGIEPRKAYYLMKIYNNLVEAEVEWAVVGVLGWSKLKELSAVITVENAKEWVERASKMTVLQIVDYIKQMAKDNKDAPGEEAVTSSVSTMTFKVHEDQKEVIQAAIDKALEEAQTEYPAVALETVCISYLAGNSPKGKATVRKMTLAEVMKPMKPMDILEKFCEIYPEIDLDVVDNSEANGDREADPIEGELV